MLKNLFIITFTFFTGTLKNQTSSYLKKAHIFVFKKIKHILNLEYHYKLGATSIPSSTFLFFMHGP